MIHEISYQLDRSVPAARGCPQTASFVLGKLPTFQNEVFVSENTASSTSSLISVGKDLLLVVLWLQSKRTA